MAVERDDGGGARGGGRPLLLVLRALGLGDLLTALPALRALAEAYPAHHRVLAMPGELAPLAELAGCVDEVLPTAGLTPLVDRVPPPDVAVNLHGRGPQSHCRLLELGPGRLVAFAHPTVPASWGGPVWRRDEHEVARWCRLLAESGIPTTPSRLDLRAPAETAAEDLAVGAPVTVLHPGASSAARRWPPERWAAVARHERLLGRPVLVTGSAGERDAAGHVAGLAGLGPESVVAGRTDVRQLAALVARAGLVLCGDTGIAHLATALGTPSVVLFGPTAPAHWGPPPDRPVHQVLWAGGTGDPHGLVPDRGLLAISVEQVLAAIERARGAARTAGRRAPLVPSG